MPNLVHKLQKKNILTLIHIVPIQDFLIISPSLSLKTSICHLNAREKNITIICIPRFRTKKDMR